MLITAGGPHYVHLLDMNADQVREAITDHAVLALEVARHAAGKMRTGGTLLLVGGTGGRRIRRGLGIIPSRRRCCHRSLRRWPSSSLRFGSTSSPPVSSTPRCRRRSSAIGLDARRDELRATLPIGRVVGPADVAALAVHIMSNTALTGATYDIDGGQQFTSA